MKKVAMIVLLLVLGGLIGGGLVFLMNSHYKPLDGFPTPTATQTSTPTPDPSATPTTSPTATPPNGTPTVTPDNTPTTTPTPDPYPYGGIVEVQGEKIDLRYNYTAELTPTSFRGEVSIKLTNLSKKTIEWLELEATWIDHKGEKVSFVGVGRSGIKSGEIWYTGGKTEGEGPAYSRIVEPITVEVAVTAATFKV